MFDIHSRYTFIYIAYNVFNKYIIFNKNQKLNVDFSAEKKDC